MGWDASLPKGYPPALNSLEPIYTPGCESKARVRTQPTHARVKSTNHEVTMPSTIPEAMLVHVCNGNRDLSITFTGMADASGNIDIVKHHHILILLAFTQLEF